MSHDYYEVLGVTPEASHEEIVRAYHERARLYHPDHNPGFIEEANRRLQELNLAYEVLIDPSRRSSHDQRRQSTVRENPAKPAPAQAAQGIGPDLLSDFIQGHLRRGHVDYVVRRRFPANIYLRMAAEIQGDEELLGAALAKEGRNLVLVVITSQRLVLGSGDVAAIDPDYLSSVEPAGGFRVGRVILRAKTGNESKWEVLPKDQAAALVRWWKQVGHDS